MATPQKSDGAPLAGGGGGGGGGAAVLSPSSPRSKFGDAFEPDLTLVPANGRVCVLGGRRA